MDIRKTKIYFGKDVALGKRIYNKLVELGAKTGPLNIFKTNYISTGYVIHQDFNLGVFDRLISEKESLFKTYPYREITIEQLEMENKKIIGWKFKEKKFSDIIQKEFRECITSKKEYDFTTGSEVEEKLKELEVLEIWCNPVYYEFKIGDLVYINKVGDYCEIFPNTFGVITNIAKYAVQIDNKSSGWVDKTDIRLATKEEIKQYNSVKVGDYEAVLIKKDLIDINGNHYSKSDILKVRDVLNLANVKHLRVGCVGQIIVNLTLINKILNLMENNDYDS